MKQLIRINGVPWIISKELLKWLEKQVKKSEHQ